MNTTVYTIETLKLLLIPKFEKYNLVRGGIFGSYARGDANESSDIDILFEINHSMPLIKWEELEEDIRKTLDKNIDFVEFGSFSKRVEKEIEKELIIIYDKTR